MKEKWFFLLLVVFMPFWVNGQSIERSLISSASVNSVGNGLDWSSSLGEPVTLTLASGDNSFFFTQGFEQPPSFISIFNYKLLFDTIFINKSSCPYAADAKVKLKIKNGTPPYVYNWNPAISTLDSATAIPSGDYVVQVTDFYGRTGSAVVNVPSETSQCAITIYSGFTPNGDNDNDTWKIDGIGLFPENNIEIYNRWGDRVWKNSNYDNKNVVFAGAGSNGANLDNGTYFYIVELVNHSGAKELYKGWVELTR